MHAVLLPPRLAVMAWPAAEPWITDALARGKADIGADEVKQQLERGGMQLWLPWDGRRARGCCVTEIVDSVRGKACNLVVVAGEQFETWRHLLDAIKAWARVQGCARLEAGGREGWVRRVKADGWRPVRTVIEMRLDDG